MGKKMVCLGGAKNHLLVVPDADRELTSANVVDSFTGCAGQRCMAAAVMLAIGDVQHIIDDMVDIAQELTLGEDMGAIISKESRQRIVDIIDQAEADGANIILDGRDKSIEGSEGYWLGPTIIDNGNCHSPVVFEGFCLGGGGDKFDIGKFERVGGLHGDDFPD
jgi:malonate-semialdehyde dehydrogenase (acetylating)/methylmalonate-semialdehyde dehydrogenase